MKYDKLHVPGTRLQGTLHHSLQHGTCQTATAFNPRPDSIEIYLLIHLNVEL